MQTVNDNLKEMANEIENLLLNLLLNHSSIYRWNKPGSRIISTAGDYEYIELEEEGRQIQAQLLEKYRHFFALLSVMLKNQPKDTLNILSEEDSEIMRIIEQNVTWCKNTQEALHEAVQALQTELELLNRLYDPSDGEAILVPDTNALLYNPDLESWAFPDSAKFTIVLLPTVLSELDSLKMNHRNEDVREKAKKLIRKIKDYRRRGSLASGVYTFKK